MTLFAIARVPISTASESVNRTGNRQHMRHPFKQKPALRIQYSSLKCLIATRYIPKIALMVYFASSEKAQNQAFRPLNENVNKTCSRHISTMDSEKWQEIQVFLVLGFRGRISVYAIIGASKFAILISER